LNATARELFEISGSDGCLIEALTLELPSVGLEICELPCL
jgi:hypothetical protein